MMEKLNLMDNKFEGETDFSHLPLEPIMLFDIGGNAELSGHIPLEYADRLASTKVLVMQCNYVSMLVCQESKPIVGVIRREVITPITPGLLFFVKIFIGVFSMLLLVCIDTPIGRIDHSSISQQTLMELLIDKVTNKYTIIGEGDTPKDISQWSAVYIPGIDDDKPFWYTNANNSGEITDIKFAEIGLTGSVQLEWLPPTVTKCNFSHNRLSGTINLSHLPDVLEVLLLNKNSFTGTLSLTRLPSVMRVFSVAKNDLSGSVDLTYLPETMEELDLTDNNFEKDNNVHHPTTDTCVIFAPENNEFVKGVENENSEKLLKSVPRKMAVKL